MKFYKCIKEPEVVNANDINMFISYTFYSNSNIGSNTTSSFYQNNQPRFTLGYIYRTNYFNDGYIVDDSATSRKLDDVMEYLEPYELEIDELSKKIIENKKDDEIEILPMREDKDFFNSVYYFITVSTHAKNGTIATVQLYSTSIADGLIECYRRLRTRNSNYSMFRLLIHDRLYPHIKRKS